MVHIDEVILQHSTWIREVYFEDENGNPIDLSGWSAELQCREHYTDPSPVLQLTVGAGIAIDGPAGLITLRIEAAETAVLKTHRLGYYDLRTVSAGGIADRPFGGTMTVQPGATP